MTENSTQEATAFRLTEAWVSWLVENLRLRVPPGAIVAAMVEKGCPPDTARILTEAFSLRNNPKGPPKSTRLAKAKWLFESLHLLQSTSSSHPLAERESIDRNEFYERFYALNYPVVYRSCLSPRKLSDQLSWERLETEFGDMEVEVQEGRSSTDDFERKSETLRSRSNLADFIRRAREAVDSNDFYMTARNASSNSSLIEKAIDPAEVCPELLDGTQAKGRVFLWVGPSGTFTPAHHDLTNNLFLQIKGEKKFRLASSLTLLEVDNDQHCYLSSSLSELDQRRQSAGQPTLSFTVTLREGDVLFIPLGWWHEVRGLSASLSVSATNFQSKNDFFQNYGAYGRLDS